MKGSLAELEETRVSRLGWHTPLPDTVPRPTYMPAVLAAGIVTMALGVVTTVYITGVGLSVCVLAIGGWISEMLRETS